MSAERRLVVVDDHALFRRGLIRLLQDISGLRVVGEAGDGETALPVIRDSCPDLVLLDVNMPGKNGVEVLREIRRDLPSLPVLMLTISRDDDALLGAISAGANGYLLKNAEPETLRAVIERVLDGEAFLDPDVTGQVFDALRRLDSQRGKSLLSPRELQLVDCMRRGMTTSEMGQELFISENTVKTHVRHILEKLHAHTRADAVAKAASLNLI
jgi:DNA-binding NarL/FixJ family response regulator